jgi:hypothetical protein
MDMQVENSLTRVCAGVGDEAVSILGDAFFARDLLRHAEEVTDQRFVLRFEGADRFDVFVRHDEDMCLRYGVDIAEGGRFFISVDDIRFGFAEDDLAEDAGVGHDVSDP